MKKTFLYISVMLFAVPASVRSYAQQPVRLTLGYNMNMPLGDFKDFMGKNSYRGFNGEFSFPLNGNLRLGVGVAHSDYYEKFPRQLYDAKEGTISAVLTHSVQTTPVLAKLNYNFIPAAAVQPYAGIGAGFNLVSFREYLGEFENIGRTAFKPALNAGAGVNIPFNRSTNRSGINLGANYNFMPFNYADIKRLDNWGAQLGIYFPL